MRHISLVGKQITVNDLPWNNISVLRKIVLVLPFWKVDSDLNKVESCLEIEEALDEAETHQGSIDNTLKISNEAWTYLKSAMQLQGITPFNDEKLNRLYMTLYKNVLRAQNVKEEKKTE